MHNTDTLATTLMPKMDGPRKVLSVSRFNPLLCWKIILSHDCLQFIFQTGSAHSPFYAQNMMYMRAYDPSGFQRTSPYGMGKMIYYFELWATNWFPFDSRKCNGLSIWWRSRMCELWGDQHSTLAKRWDWTLLVQCLRAVPQDEWNESSIDQAE